MRPGDGHWTLDGMDGKLPARSVWSGSITMGIVVLPVKLYSATEEHSVRLHEIHRADGGRIRYKRVCEREGREREIPYEAVGKGWELPDGRMVPLTDEDLERLPVPTRHEAKVLGFVTAGDIDPLMYSRAYYAGPASAVAERPYALLVEALARTGHMAVAKIAIRRRERLAVLRPRNGVLIVQTLLWPDEVRDLAPDLVPSMPVTERELELAELLMRELTGVEMRELHDEYRRALDELVEAKVSGGEIEALPPPEPAVDLVAALEESVRAARHK
jgi:DNA end-binding protein Ku